VSHVLNEQKKKQVLALGWSLRQIEKATGIRRETAGGYLKAAGIGLRPPGAWGKKAPPKPANGDGVTTGSAAAAESSPPPETGTPAAPSAGAASVSEPYREVIENGREFSASVRKADESGAVQPPHQHDIDLAPSRSID